MIGKSSLHFGRYLLGLDPPHTQTTNLEQSTLARYAERKLRLVEIGVYEGFTTSRLAQAMAPDGTLFAIDPFFGGRLGICWGKWIARREAAKLRPTRNIRFVQALSHEAKGLISGDFDFVFIDGDHSLEGISRDWSDWSARILPSGLIALHDTRVPGHNPHVSNLGSFQYFESHIRADRRFRLLEQADSLSVLQRIE